jgi:hypothetical protein
VLAATSRAAEIANEAGARMVQLKSEADSRIQAANLPETTTTVVFRNAFIGSGRVATIRNISAKAAPFTALIERPSTQQKRSLDFVIDGNGMKEIGQREGWAFVQGDTIRMAQPNHKAVIYTAN